MSLTPNGTPPKLDDVLTVHVPVSACLIQVRLTSFDVASVVKLSVINGSSDVMAITQSEGFASVWRLSLNQAKTEFSSLALVCCHPVGSNMFDASLGASGLTAVYVDFAPLETLTGTVEPQPEQTYSVMNLHNVFGWRKTELLSVPVGMAPSGIWLVGNGVIVSLINGSTSQSALYKVGQGILWQGAWLDYKTVSVSRCGMWMSWLGLSTEFSRIHSTHDNLLLLNMDSESVVRISSLGECVIASGFLDTETLFYTTQVAVEPGWTMLYDLVSGQLCRLTGSPITRSRASWNAHVTESLEVYPTLVTPDHPEIDLPRTAGCDRLVAEKWQLETNAYLQGIIYSCNGVSTKAKPYILLLHGGPGMAVSPFRSAIASSSDWILKMILEGYKVLTITYRGSFGLGDEWAQASIGNQGKADLQDVLNVIDVFSDSLAAIVGSSYGGFLCLHTFCSGIEVVEKIPKFVALYPYISTRCCASETGDFKWEAEYCGLNQWMVPQYPVPAECVAPDVVPKLYTASTERSLLMFHGESDSVCPISQSRQVFHILRQRGSTDVSLVSYKGEGHGFTKKETREDCIKRLLDFLK